MKNRNENLDSLKGFAILLVMFGHIQVHNQMTDPYLYDVIKSLQMPLFMLISGYLAGAGTKIQNLGQYKSRLGKRAFAYLVPFFAWLAVQHISFVPRALKTVLFQLDYGLWFLMTLFLFTWMVYTAQLAAAKWKSEWIFWAVFLASCLLVLIAYLKGVTFLSPSILIIYLPYYVAAYFVGLHPIFLEKIPDAVKRYLAYAGGVLFLAMAIFLDLVTVTGIVMLGVQTLASFLGCMFVIQLFGDWKPNKIKHMFSFLGQYTLEIYVLHYQFAAILNPAKKIYQFWSVEGLLYSFVAFVVMSVITFVGIIFIQKVKILRMVFFGKR